MKLQEWPDIVFLLAGVAFMAAGGAGMMHGLNWPGIIFLVVGILCVTFSALIRRSRQN
jgi:hypothetical protein